MLLALLLGCAPEPASIPDYDALSLVDPMVGTGGVGAEIASVNPGAAWPNGLTLLGPDTRTEAGAPGFYHCAGYHYEDTHVTGFSHTHAHGMGVTDYGAVQLMPRAAWDPSYTRSKGRMAPFDHHREHASPGRYTVDLVDDGTGVDLVATAHGGLARFLFADGADPVVIFDLGTALGDDEVAEAEIHVDGATVTGAQRLLGAYSERFGGVHTRFFSTVHPAPVAWGTWTDPGAPEVDVAHAAGTLAGAWLVFPEGTPEVEVRTGVSYVDVDGARANHAAELEGLPFDTIVERVEAAWRARLGSVRVAGGTDDERVIFHTALYHASLMPSLVQDVDGRYRGVDGAVHTADFGYYSNLSLWDTFRTLHPWYALAWPDLQRDMARSLVRMTADGGSLPRWPMAHGYTGGMVGTPAVQVLAETHLKGIDDWDVDAGYEAAVRAVTEGQADAGRADLEGYASRGWAAADATGAAASKTLEYAWSDAALAGWAAERGDGGLAARLATSSRGWRELWRDDEPFVHARNADGSWARFRGPLFWDTAAYTEGNAWHYVFGAPLDTAGMAELHGGVEPLLDRMASYWDEVYAEDDDALPDDLYWHGNEPDLHYAFMGALLGVPDASVEPARWLLGAKYAAAPRGLDGNDDSGTLSAWYLFAALGIYPVAGTDTYAVASPLFERAEIDRPDGTWVIDAPGASATARWPTSVSVGDVDVEGTFTHADWQAWRSVRFDLGTLR